jgi:hypothetical protein
LKPGAFQLWASMGQGESTCTASPQRRLLHRLVALRRAQERGERLRLVARARGVVEVRHLVVHERDEGRHHQGVAAHTLKFVVTGFSRWVKGQAQGLQPGAFKLWVKLNSNWIQVVQPHQGGLTAVERRELVAQGLTRARGPVHARVAARDVAVQVAFESKL